MRRLMRCGRRVVMVTRGCLRVTDGRGRDGGSTVGWTRVHDARLAHDERKPGGEQNRDRSEPRCPAHSRKNGSNTNLVPVVPADCRLAGITVRVLRCILRSPAELAVVRLNSGTRGAAVGIAKKTVLLVEDNEDNRIIYATALRYAGYDVLEAVTGTEGVYQARTNLPDLVLMDISVPELDGWEATAILKADPTTKHIPIIAVTAHALPGDRERSLEAGCDGYLAKPIPPATLLAEVDRRFGRPTPSYTPVHPVHDDGTSR